MNFLEMFKEESGVVDRRLLLVGRSIINQNQTSKVVDNLEQALAYLLSHDKHFTFQKVFKFDSDMSVSELTTICKQLSSSPILIHFVNLETKRGEIIRIIPGYDSNNRDSINRLWKLFNEGYLPYSHKTSRPDYYTERALDIWAKSVAIFSLVTKDTKGHLTTLIWKELRENLKGDLNQERFLDYFAEYADDLSNK